MRKRASSTVKKRQGKFRTNHFYNLVVILGLFGAGCMVLFTFFSSKQIFGQNQPDKRQQVIILPPRDDYGSSKDLLQLRTFLYITIPPTIPIPSPPASQPTPDASCRPDAPRSRTCNCPDINAVSCPTSLGYSCDLISNGGMQTGPAPGPYSDQCTWQQGNGNGYDAHINDSQCTPTCFGKPVIYLYPTKPTNVSVKLTIPGRVAESDPLYPDGGWQNVLALPGGSLVYRGNVYHELYYESAVTKNPVPPTGDVVAAGDLEQHLEMISGKLGLIPAERQELLAYWMPRLESLHSPYVLISVLTPEQKEEVDHVDVSPLPETEIAFLLYFKPLAEPVAIDPLVLPDVVPARNGFTMVEWGGTIDNN